MLDAAMRSHPTLMEAEQGTVSTPLRAVVLGVGGLGCPAVLALLAAGVRDFVLVDGDRVDTSNLQRQVLFCGADAGRPKTEAARTFILQRAPDAHVECVDRALVFDEVEDWIAALDAEQLVFECTDAPGLKFAVNDACVHLGRPVVIGGVLGWIGRVLGVAPGRACYRCYFEAPPPRNLAPSCATAGVLGAAAGVMGAWMAAVGHGLRSDPQVHGGRLYAMDLVRLRPQVLHSAPRERCPACQRAPTTGFT